MSEAPDVKIEQRGARVRLWLGGQEVDFRSLTYRLRDVQDPGSLEIEICPAKSPFVSEEKSHD